MKKITTLISAILLLASGLLAGDCISTIDSNGQQKLNWSTYTYTIVGHGVMKTAAEEPNRAKAYEMAKTYAELDAMKQALYAIEGTLFTSTVKGENKTEVTELMEAKSAGMIKGIKFISDNEIKKTTHEGYVYFVEVVAEISLFDTPAGAILNKQVEDDYNIIKNINPSTIPQPKVSMETDQPIVIASVSAFPVDLPKKGEFTIPKTYTPATPSASDPYTSVIFHVKSFKLDRSMCPKIRVPNGDVAWCGADFDANLLGDRGILAYCNTINDAKKHSYCGKNPLIINAINVAGNSKFKTDIVISNEDAALLKVENTKGKFLDDFNVIVVADKYGM